MRPLVFTHASAGSNVAETVIGAHPLPHDLRRHADHVRVPDPAALHHGHDLHARRQFALTGLNAQHARIRAFERVDDRRRSAGQRPAGNRFDEHAFPRRADAIERGANRRRHLAAVFVGDQRDAIGRRNRKAHFNGVPRAGFEIGHRGSKNHRRHCISYEA